MKHLRQQLRSLKINNSDLSPDGFWVKETRNKLMEYVAKKENAEKVSGWEKMLAGTRIFFTSQFNAYARPAVAAIVVVFLSVAGWGASVSASYSLPGDTLYGVKLAKEKTQIAVAGLTGQKEKKAALLVTAAKTRATETKALVEQSRLDQVESTLNSLKETVAEANASLKDVAKDNPEKAVNMVQEVAGTTGVILETLNSAMAGIPTSTASSTGMVSAVAQITDAQKIVTNQVLAVRTTVEQKQEQTEDGSTFNDTKITVSTTITTATVANTTTTAPVSSTPMVEITTTPTTTTVGGAIDVAQKMADGGKLSEAIDMAKQTLVKIKETETVELVVPETAPSSTALESTSSTCSTLSCAISSSTVPVVSSTTTNLQIKN